MLRTKRLLFLAFFLVALGGHTQNIPQVPSKIQIADIKVTITEGAKKDIQKDVNMLRSSEKFFKIKLDRVVLYMPLVERILKEEGIPNDIKYLAIQESSFIPDAVSTSKAVGYWQFKDFTAREVGMRVDNKVDERKNIHASTRGAAKYFKTHQKKLDNWANSINSHMTGLAGIQKYLSPKDKGAKKMTITKKTHWYLKRFIAHKIAFQDELDYENSKGLELLEYKNGAGKDLAKIAKEFDVDVEKLKAYNKWLIHGRIPGDRRYVVIVPVQRGNRKARKLAENSDLIERKKAKIETPAKSQPKAEVVYPKGKVASFVGEQAGVIRINGVKAILASSSDDYESILVRSGLKEKKFLKFNDLGSRPQVKAGDIYFIKKKKKKSSMGFYTVDRGESMWDVSQKLGMRLSALMKKNRMTIRDVPKPGRVLWLSVNRPSNVEVEYQELPPLVEKPTEFYTKKTIAKNPPEAEEVKPVQQEKVEEVEPKPEPEIEEEEPPLNTHIVQTGETFWRIAKAYGVTVAEILNWNNLKEGTALSVGQKLLIDGVKRVSAEIKETPIKKERPTKTHIVRGGETIFAIATKYEMNVNDLLKLNDLTDADVLSVGQELKVFANATENDSDTKEVEANETGPEPVEKGASIHIVKAGESFYGIARQYGLKVDELLELNGMNSNAVLSIGQELMVTGTPAQEEKQPEPIPMPVKRETTTHKVVAGESFYGIARQYGLKVDELLELNNLEADAVLSIGQELKVEGNASKAEEKIETPVSDKRKTTIHEVKAGDTLYKIAREYNMTLDELKQLNDKQDNSLSLGEKLKVYE
ncbi:MAG: LysM peptidoglycan-binding domain-containing protein [Cytophagales bacterium]|nr:LysM peptidoglycan-binding domain-containing protein [Cytophagales bacterium]